MKKILILGISLILLACSNDQGVINNDTSIQGDEINIELDGYAAMCQREPESVLCNAN